MTWLLLCVRDVLRSPPPSRPQAEPSRPRHYPGLPSLLMNTVSMLDRGDQLRLTVLREDSRALGQPEDQVLPAMSSVSDKLGSDMGKVVEILPRRW